MGDAQPVPIWARHDREAPVRWESSSVVACTAPRSGDLVGNVTVELSSNGSAEYTKVVATQGGKADCGGAEHRSRGRRDGGEVGGRRDDE